MEEQKKEMQRQMQEMRDRSHGNGMCEWFIQSVIEFGISQTWKKKILFEF